MNLKLVKVAAFFARIHRRQTGAKSDPRQRAATYLGGLQRDPTSIGYQVTIDMLSRESDLFYEEEALHPATLELQLKVIELAKTHPSLEKCVHQMLGEIPIAKLLAAILAQAVNDGADHLRIQFNGEIKVYSRIDRVESESMRIPATLEKPLRGFATRLIAMPYQAWLPYVKPTLQMPKNPQFAWTQNVLEIDL